MMNNIFYVYVYLDPRKPGKFNFNEYEFNFEPFYVGKGYGNRCLKHLQILSRVDNPMKTNKIKSIFKLGYEPIIVKYKIDLTENDAFQIEKELIKTIGRIDLSTGTLTNLNDGGIGGHRNPSKELRFKFGTGTRGKTYEEIYGIEKAKELKEKRILSNKNRNIHQIIDRSSINTIQEKYLDITTKTKYNSIWVLVSPNNDVYITRNLLKICEDLKISRRLISKLGRGLVKHYNYWKVKNFNDKNIVYIKNNINKIVKD